MTNLHNAPIGDLDQGAEHYRNGVPLEAIAADADTVRQGWLDEQRRTWSAEWPTTEGYYWAWVRWQRDEAWERRMLHAVKISNGLAYAVGGHFITPGPTGEFAEALFCPMVEPPPPPLPEGAQTKGSIG